MNTHCVKFTVVSSGVSIWCFLGEQRSSWISSQLYLIRKMLKWPWGIMRNESNCAQCLSINALFQRAATHGHVSATNWSHFYSEKIKSWQLKIDANTFAPDCFTFVGLIGDFQSLNCCFNVFFLIAITKMVHVAEAFVFWLRAIMIKGQK